MLPTFDKLTRMLIQERRLDYKNKAVMGGLDKFMSKWVVDARQEATNEAELTLIKEVEQELIRYPDIAADDRPNYIHRILVKLNKSQSSKSATKRPSQSPAKPKSR
ncbi:MAG: hypothetical protein AAF485_08930, partial [Chloroflexota bacterium]